MKTLLEQLKRDLIEGQSAVLFEQLKSDLIELRSRVRSCLNN